MARTQQLQILGAAHHYVFIPDGRGNLTFFGECSCETRQHMEPMRSLDKDESGLGLEQVLPGWRVQ